jgi:hypothetical protein
MTDDAGPILDLLAERMQLKALDQATDARLSDGFSALSKELRRPMLLAHLGFPFFDIATLPLLQGEGMDEFDPIRVDRISPDDATSIRKGGAEATLKGIQFNSFGAFFSRAYRENDYLWGRLHGAERLIDIVLSALPFEDRIADGSRRRDQAQRLPRDPRRGGARLTSIPGLFASCAPRSADCPLSLPRQGRRWVWLESWQIASRRASACHPPWRVIRRIAYRP